MKDIFSGSESLGSVVSRFPGASNLFKAAKIDYCCNGDRTLSDSLKDHELAEEQFIAKLNQMYSESKFSNDRQTNWPEKSNSELIDYIVNTHHAYLVTELPVIGAYVLKILRVHGRQHNELSKLHRLFFSLKMDFEQHLIDEEENVFPLIKQFDQHSAEVLKKRITQEIEILEADHSGVGEMLKEIRELTQDYKLPEDACSTYAAAFEKLEGLESDTFQHVHLENNILFPRFS